jgi:hypothetical protein
LHSLDFISRLSPERLGYRDAQWPDRGQPGKTHAGGRPHFGEIHLLVLAEDVADVDEPEQAQ